MTANPPIPPMHTVWHEPCFTPIETFTR